MGQILYFKLYQTILDFSGRFLFRRGNSFTMKARVKNCHLFVVVFGRQKEGVVVVGGGSGGAVMVQGVLSVVRENWR